MDGVLNVYKDKGYTSHDVVAIIRKLTRAKCGHTGTLDPNATGVLPICLGKATKIAMHITAETKKYAAEIIFGAETDTQDATGVVLEEKTDFDFTVQQFNAAVQSFKGDYSQIPPMYSAVKLNGKKLYELARQGKVVEREPRVVHIYDIAVVEANNLPKTAVINVMCSKGTYIRTLCSDLGKRLGVFAHMGELVRTQNGVFSIEDSVGIDEIRRRAKDGTLGELIVSVEAVTGNGSG